MSTRSRSFPGASAAGSSNPKPNRRTGLQHCLLAAAIAATALVSAAAVQAGTAAPAVVGTAARVASQSGVAKSGVATSVAAKATADISVSIVGTGALYLSRDTAALNFWLVDAAAGTVQRKASLSFDPTIDQIIAIELGDAVTGVFFADNLRVAGDQFRLAFRGDIADGGIAMPLKAGALAPLAAITVPDEIVAVDPSQTDLLALIDTQHQIFARVHDVTQMQSDQIELFKLEAQNELVDFYETQIHEGPVGRAILDDAAAGIQAQHDAFLAQVNADLAELQGKAAQISQAGNEQIARYGGPVLQCINGQVAKISERMKSLDARLSTIVDETYSERTEAEIAATEAEFQRNETALLACIDTLGFENYAPTVNVNEEGAGYQPIATAAQALLDDIEPRVEAWRVALEAAGMDKGARIENTAIATNAAAFDSYFSEWASPTYTSEDPIGVPSLPGTRAKRLQDIRAATAALDGDAKAAAGVKGGEVLCDAETWNFEFNIGAASVVIGTPWDDNIVTGSNINLVFALRGDDCIETHAGYDLVLAGPGADTVYAGDDHDVVLGGRDNDEIHGGAGNSYTVTAGPVVLEFDLGNLLIGQAGDDRIFGGEVAADRGDDGNVDDHGYTDFVFGDALLFGHPAGNDVIDGEMGIDFLFGQQGNDQIMNIVPGVFGVDGLDVPFGTFFFGGIGNDTLIGSNTTVAGVFPLLGDFMFGNDGNDIISANAGMDFVFGANGDDRIDAGRDMDFAFGSDGNDSVVGNDGMDLVTGNLGNDVVRGSAGLIDLVFGGEGNDSLFGDDGMDLVFGRDGVDTISGGNGIDLIFGAADADLIDGNAGIDLVFGGPAEDTINGGDDIDLLFGGSESDTIRGGNGTDVIFGNDNSQKKDEFLYGEAGIDLMFGNSGNDVMEGGADLDLMFGNRGDDKMSGNDGTDLVFGNTGMDLINGNAGLDILFGGSEWDVINGGADTDIVFGGDGCDAIDGGDGADILFGGDYMDLIVGGNSLDIVFGGAGKDHVQGGNDADFLFGGDDDDYLAGDGSLDVTFGGSGNDHMLGGSGLDLMFGGNGNDYARGDDDADFIFGGDNNDIIDGAGGSDFMLAGSGDDKVNSGTGTDFSFGNGGADRLRAVEDRNFAFGGSGNDVVDGYSTSSDPWDLLSGGADNDSITGNQSSTRDLRLGGSGSDTKVWNTTYVSASEFSASWSGSATCQ